MLYKKAKRLNLLIINGVRSRYASQTQITKIGFFNNGKPHYMQLTYNSEKNVSKNISEVDHHPCPCVIVKPIKVV